MAVRRLLDDAAMRPWKYVAAFILLLPASARADGIDTHLFRPALDSRGLVSVNGADVLPANHVSLGLTLDYGRNVATIRNSYTGTFHFDYGVADRAVVGASTPALLMNGDNVDVQSFGWFALHGKVKLVSGVAAALQIGVPISDAPKSGGADPALWYWPMMILEHRFGAVRLAGNFGYRGHAASNTALLVRDGTARDGSRVTAGAGVSFRVLEPLDLVGETYGTYLLGDGTSASLRPSVEALGGIKLFVDKSSYLTIAAGRRYTDGFEGADLRGVIGFVFEPPPYEHESNGHGDDELVDTDGDGIPDVEDACPYGKGPRTNNPRTNGCPPLPEPPPPPPPDRDVDGVPDVEDACPDVFGDKHPEDPTRNGCPDVLIGPNDITVFDKILFETASATILPASFPILDKVAKALNEHPDLLLVEVAGHADERGGEKYNLTLTQARVDSVVRALVERKVDKERLRSKGYGFYCPRDEGHDEPAWSKNRRVEFLIVKSRSGAPAPQLGCENATKHGVRPDPIP